MVSYIRLIENLTIPEYGFHTLLLVVELQLFIALQSASLFSDFSGGKSFRIQLPALIAFGLSWKLEIRKKINKADRNGIDEWHYRNL